MKGKLNPLAIAFIVFLFLGLSGNSEPPQQGLKAEDLGVERIGPPTMYMPDLERYQEYEARPPEKFYPIPQNKITCQTYMQWIEDSGHLGYVANAGQHGPHGPRHLMPVLAKYVQTGERKYGDACLVMLKAFDRWLRERVASKGWHSQFIDEPVYLGLYRRYLEKGGLLHPERDVWFREMILFMAKHLHPWDTAESFWRGPMHRAQGEGVMRTLASTWFPDCPEAALWKKYGQTVYQDWWRFKDFPPNDTGYYFGILHPLMLRAELLDDQEFFTHPGMKNVWERLLYEISPDGAILPYGAHNGWNATAGMRIHMLELLARKTKDGRYRFGAHRLMNYLLYQQEVYKKHHILHGPESTEVLALAYLFADDTISPVQPDAGSRILYRKETLRLRGSGIFAKKIAAKYLHDLDTAKDKGNICCSLIVTDKTLPAKLVLRSGWGAGDLFILVDLFPRHDPLNVGGIIGLIRWGVALLMTISAKGESDENRLLIEDLSGKAPLRKNQNSDLADPFYQEVDVKHFQDMKRATFATITIANYLGLPVKHTREFTFIKNRFLVVRDLPEFEVGFPASVFPVINTQNVGPQVGNHWANTFFNAPMGSTQRFKNPPFDLLSYFAPREGCTLQIVDRTATDPRTAPVPVQLRWQWKGQTQAGQKLVFTQVLYPHPPSRKMPRSNAPGAVRPEELLGESGANNIEILQDSVATTVLRIRPDKDRTEWVVCNPEGKRVEIDRLATDARFAYVDCSSGRVVGLSAIEASFLSLDQKDLFRQAERKNRE